MATFEEYQAYLDSISQPEEEIIQPLRGEDFSAKLDNAFYAVRPVSDADEIGPRHQTGDSYWDDIVQGYDEFSPVGIGKDLVGGLATITRQLGVEASRIPHPQSPYSDAPPSPAQEEYDESSFLGRTAYNIGFPLAKIGAGAAGFLPELANIAVNPEQYPTEGGASPLPGSLHAAARRFDLFKEQVGGLWQMIRDLPATMSAGGQQLVTGSPPTEDELRTWQSAASWLYPDPKGAINRFYDDPEGAVFAATILTGAYNKLVNKASGSGRTPNVTRQDIAKSLGMERNAVDALAKIGEGVEAAEIGSPKSRFELSSPKLITETPPITEGLKLAHSYATNPTNRYWGMAPEVNKTLLDVKRRVFDHLLADPEPKAPGKGIQDIAEFKGKMAERRLEIKQAPLWIKKQMAAARKGYRDWRKDINFRDMWQTPARIIPEIFNPVEKIHNIMLDELSTTLEVWRRAGETVANKKNKKLKGSKIGQFLDAHSTEDINNLINEFNGGKSIPPEFKLSWNELQFAALTRSMTDLLFSRSGAPKSSYRSNYITWLRDEMMRGDDGKLDITNIPKELVQQLPKDIYVRFLEHRAGEVPPEVMNVFDIIPVYTQAMLKKIYLEPLFEQLQPTFDKLPANKKRYANHWVNKLRGKPTGSIDMFARGLEKTTGRRQGLVDKVSRNIASSYYHAMLGGALDSPLKNLTQLGLTAAKSDTRSFANGIVDFLRKGKAEPSQMKLIDAFTDIFESDKLAQSMVDKLGNINMTPFQTIEVVNRGITYFVAKRMFFDRGMKEGSAHNQSNKIAQRYAAEFAREFNRETQFTYGKLGTSPYLQNPIYRTFGQFTSFPLKYAETLLNWGKNDKRAVTRYLMLAGAMTMIGDKHGFDVSEIWGTKAFPAASQIFSGVSPLGTGIVNIGRAVNDFTEGKKYEAWDKIREELIKPIPSQRFVRKVAKAFENMKRGDIRTKHLNFIKKTDTQEQIRYIFGLRSLDMKEIYENQKKERKTSVSFDDARAHHLRNIKRAELNGEDVWATQPSDSDEMPAWLSAFKSNWKFNMNVPAKTKRVLYNRDPLELLYRQGRK